MKKQLISLLSLSTLCLSTSVHAYRVELGFDRTASEFDYDDFDYTEETIDLSTYVRTYFSDVDDDEGPYGEAAFLSKAGFVDVTLFKSNTENEDTGTDILSLSGIGVSSQIVIKDKIILAPSVAFSYNNYETYDDLEANEADIGFGIGGYLSDNHAIIGKVSISSEYGDGDDSSFGGYEVEAQENLLYVGVDYHGFQQTGPVAVSFGAYVNIGAGSSEYEEDYGFTEYTYESSTSEVLIGAYVNFYPLDMLSISVALDSFTRFELADEELTGIFEEEENEYTFTEDRLTLGISVFPIKQLEIRTSVYVGNYTEEVESDDGNYENEEDASTKGINFGISGRI